MKLSGLHHVSQIFLLLGTTGLIWQIVLIAGIYFSYKVSTQMTVQIPDDVMTESVNFCSRYTDIIDFDRLNRDTGRAWQYTLNGSLVRKYQHDLSIGEIFKYTPQEEEVISVMWYRGKKSFDREEVSGKDIHMVFRVEKYVYLEFMCYKIAYRPEFSFTMPYTYFAVTPSSPGQVYEFFVNKSSLIYRTNFMKIVITNSAAAAYPFRSISKVSTLSRYWNDSLGVSRYNRFKNFKIRISTWLLPPPYETSCLNYSQTVFTSDAECMQACIQAKTMAAFDKVPFSVIVNNSCPCMDKHIISYADVTNDTLMERLLQMQEECRRSWCGKTSCSYGIALTQTKVIIEPQFRIRLDVPSRAWIYVKARARLTLVEFVTYVMGIVGTYTGLSVTTFDPVKVARVSVKKLKAFFWVASEMRIRAKGTLSSPSSYPFPRTGFDRASDTRKRCRSFM